MQETMLEMELMLFEFIIIILNILISNLLSLIFQKKQRYLFVLVLILKIILMGKKLLFFDQMIKVSMWSSLPTVLIFPITMMVIALSTASAAGRAPFEGFESFINLIFSLWILYRTISGLMILQQRGRGHAIATFLLPILLLIVVAAVLFIATDMGVIIAPYLEYI